MCSSIKRVAPRPLGRHNKRREDPLIDLMGLISELHDRWICRSGKALADISSLPCHERVLQMADCPAWRYRVFFMLISGCSLSVISARLFASVPAMRMRGAMLNPAVNLIALTLILAAGLMGQTPAPSSTAVSDADKVIEGFRQVSRELNDSVKSFYTHLDQAIARYDRGYRPESGRPVLGADVDLIGGPPDLTWSAIQRFVSFRMLAARNEEYAPAPVADLLHIEQLILEARKRVDASATVLRRLLVVSVADFDPHNDAVMKVRHDQLLKARAAVEEASRRAMLALPLDQPDASTPRNNCGEDVGSAGPGTTGAKGAHLP